MNEMDHMQAALSYCVTAAVWLDQVRHGATVEESDQVLTDAQYAKGKYFGDAVSRLEALS